MFYSHEVLTSRKYGVATVWLVATLGAKSTLKRINRKQILDVDVPKACQTIVDPVAPMALRLQGNLLYGVSRVYLQQCGYVLSDAQNAHNSMRMLLRTVENLALDPDAGKARPEQLILPDDPSFLPEHALQLPALDLDFDLGFDADIINRSGDSQSLAPFGSQYSQSTHVEELGGLVLPTSSPGPPGSFRVQGADEDADLSGLLGTNAEFQFDDPDFTFDEDGALVEGPPPQRVARTPAGSGGAAMLSDAALSAKVRKDHEEGRAAAVQLPDDPMDIDLPNFQDDVPQNETSPTGAPEARTEQAEVIHSTSTVSAPMRQKRRAARVLPVDSRMELRNKDLAAWNTNYLQNMDVAVRDKNRSRCPHQAKKDAEQFVWGNGIGDIGHQFNGIPVPDHFQMFIGDNLFELITGAARKKPGRPKRDRDSGIDEATQEESRNVRQKTAEPEEQVGRGHEDEGFFMPGDDEVELPRDVASPLDDDQLFSAMPWNISASIRGSSAVPRSTIKLTDQGRPGSRLVSASPLLGRGQPLSLDALKDLESDGIDLGGDDFGPPEPSSSAAPQQPTTRVTEALSAEGENFVLFVSEAIVEKRNRMQAEDVDTDEVTFAELLPPTQNSKMIACQGLMMVLGLGTKGMLDVQQPEHFGAIGIKLTEKAKASQVVEISDGSDSDGYDTAAEEVDVRGGGEGQTDDEMHDAHEGHFEEQFAAGHALQQDDDHDELYND